MNCVIRDVNFVQEFIYFMNEEEQRNYLIKYHLEQTKTNKTHKWLGTWYVKQKRNGDLYFVQKKMTIYEYIKNNITKEEKIYIFNVCLMYNDNRVHYVAFIWINGELISFDPGIQFYPEGQDIIVPKIEKEFQKWSKTARNYLRMGECRKYNWKNKKTGIQYNQKDKIFPADSFCQTWTLYFTIRMLYISIHDEIETTINYLCEIKPKEREYYLISMFIFPSLMYHKEFLLRFTKKLKGTYDEYSILSFLWKDLDRCFPN